MRIGMSLSLGGALVAYFMQKLAVALAVAAGKHTAKSANRCCGFVSKAERRHIGQSLGK